MKREELPRPVLAYAENLKHQILALLARHNLKADDFRKDLTTEELLGPKFASLRKKPKDYEKLARLLELAAKTLKEGRIPPEALADWPVLHAKEALNPYREALLAGGIPENNPSCEKTTEIVLNLPELLDEQTEAYRKAGLESWAEDIESVKYTPELTQEQQKIIEQEIHDGAIAVFMPGREIQLETTLEQYQKLKPVYIKDGKQQEIADTFVVNTFQQEILKKSRFIGDNIPECPYLLLIRPSQKPELRTSGKLLDEQIDELWKINQERKAEGKAPANPIKPLEYMALQKIFTENIHGMLLGIFPQKIDNLTPLDTATFSNFMDFPFLHGVFTKVEKRINIVIIPLDIRDANLGFRFAVRVEL